MSVKSKEHRIEAREIPGWIQLNSQEWAFGSPPFKERRIPVMRRAFHPLSLTHSGCRQILFVEAMLWLAPSTIPRAIPRMLTFNCLGTGYFTLRRM